MDSWEDSLSPHSPKHMIELHHFPGTEPGPGTFSPRREGPVISMVGMVPARSQLSGLSPAPVFPGSPSTASARFPGCWVLTVSLPTNCQASRASASALAPAGEPDQKILCESHGPDQSSPLHPVPPLHSPPHSPHHVDHALPALPSAFTHTHSLLFLISCQTSSPCPSFTFLPPQLLLLVSFRFLLLNLSLTSHHPDNKCW